MLNKVIQEEFGLNVMGLGITSNGTRQARIGPAAGWFGLAMLAAILANGPLAAARGVSDAFAPDAASRMTDYLGDPGRLRLAIAFYFVSTLIFVFGIPFVAGIWQALRTAGASDLVSGTFALGAALFFAGGLMSEVLSTGMAIVVQAVPAYQLDVNTALTIQGLQFAALIQGQVGLGVAMIAVAVGMWNVAGWRAVSVVGLVAGSIDVLRPLAVTTPALAIVLFVPTFVWIALASIRLLRPVDQR